MSNDNRRGLRLIAFLLAAGALTAFLVVYTIRNRPPVLPADSDHRGSARPEQCLDCHGPAGKDPRGPNHPLNDQCFNCHERP
jgi:hypothetical protein